MRVQGGSTREVVARVFGALLLVATARDDLDAKPKGPKPHPAADYVGHITSLGGTMFVIHIDDFTPDDAATAVALAGHDGNSNAIRTALGRLDAGFIKIRQQGYRVAYARRRREDSGVRIILILRNELDTVGVIRVKDIPVPPLAAVEAWLPDAGDGEATIAGSATVVFRSADDVAITDWGGGNLRAVGLRERAP